MEILIAILGAVFGGGATGGATVWHQRRTITQPNGGSSIRDQLTRIEARLDKIDDRISVNAERLAKVEAFIDLTR